MTTPQQKEAFDYFQSHAADWRAKAEGIGETQINIISQRNGFVMQVARERDSVKSFLDVGCGTGELVCEMAGMGPVSAVGVDYAPGMIELCEKKKNDAGLDNARFVVASVFDFPMEPGSYDLIAANGFIEYISQDEMLRFFDRVAAALPAGGSFVVGSRNRLFNLMSMNAYTAYEVETGGLEPVLEEAMFWANTQGMPRPGEPRKVVALQPGETRHAKHEIDVATRFQYTPFQLMKLLEERGLVSEEVYPAHIHGVTPAFKKEHPEVQTSIANLLQTYARKSFSLLVSSSSFMLHARKPG